MCRIICRYRNALKILGKHHSLVGLVTDLIEARLHWCMNITSNYEQSLLRVIHAKLGPISERERERENLFAKYQ